MDEALLRSIPGAIALVEQFGCWPSFHDAEVVSVGLNRSGPSYLKVHFFRMTSEVSGTGTYICDRHLLVTFSFGEIAGICLEGFNHQNVIAGLKLYRREEEFELVLSPCYGLAGSILVKSSAIDFEPGIPPGSGYGMAS